MYTAHKTCKWLRYHSDHTKWPLGRGYFANQASRDASAVVVVRVQPQPNQPSSCWLLLLIRVERLDMLPRRQQQSLYSSVARSHVKYFLQLQPKPLLFVAPVLRIRVRNFLASRNQTGTRKFFIKDQVPVHTSKATSTKNHGYSSKLTAP
jgi:hypothetical protein